MARPNVFQTDTKLWHPAEGWRVFPAGETDPGASWHEKEGGAPAGAATTTQALKDLITAQDQIEGLQKRLDAGANDLAEAAKARDEALASVAGLEQRVIAAEKAQADAEALATQYMRERDAARADLETATAARAAEQGQVKPAKSVA